MLDLGESNTCTLERVVQFAQRDSDSLDFFPETFPADLRPLVEMLLNQDPTARLGNTAGARWAQVSRVQGIVPIINYGM